MDCDQVFMILTRGPFPTGEPGTNRSKRIWNRAPIAGDWPKRCGRRSKFFRKPMPPAESRDLPGYWGDARPASALVAQLTRETTRTALAAECATDSPIEPQLPAPATGK